MYEGNAVQYSINFFRHYMPLSENCCFCNLGVDINVGYA